MKNSEKERDGKINREKEKDRLGERERLREKQFQKKRYKEKSRDRGPPQLTRAGGLGQGR